MHRRLRLAAGVMKQVAANPAVASRIEDRSRDEIGVMATAFNHMANSLRESHRSLEETGNLSSASVLFVLGELMDDAAEAPRPGDLGLLLAMGPGFCSELVLLEW